MNRILVVLLLISNLSFSQSNNDKAKAYFNEAQSAYSEGSYTTSISNLNSVEEFLGKTNPIILNLKIKSYYNLKDYDNAKKNFL